MSRHDPKTSIKGHSVVITHSLEGNACSLCKTVLSQNSGTREKTNIEYDISLDPVLKPK